ncbi:MAG TPA: 4Fe-4S binding protein [Cyclobacteriaceae bacterium]|nr:4Fe-4S binding protein [Cyclobacteriaceae bacterium]HPW60973.1 4Fe-4S binding protein [Cyclobacteriaceae bacterium]
MRAIKLFGLLVFIIGFTLFNVVFFLASYRLTPEAINAKISDTSKRELFLSASSDIQQQEFTSSFSFVSELKKLFEQINQEQLSNYGITQEEILDLVARGGKQFSLASVDSLYLGGDEVSEFKKKAWKDYGSWLEGRAFQSSQELQVQLQGVVTNINQYGIINKVGFDRYQVKDLIYSLTKASARGPVSSNPILFLFLTLGLCIAGAVVYILPKLSLSPGIKNDGVFFSVMKNTGWLGIFTGTWLIVFYIVLYFYPEYMTNWVALVDPVSRILNGNEAGRFFLYGFIYTLCIIVMGVRMIIHYRHSKYQVLRTCSVMFFQTAFAFLIPEILIRLNKPYFDFKNIWPLDYSFFFDSRWNELISGGTLGIFMLGWGIALILIGVPVLVYFFGKRWYCSWVCGCGGLAETLGDPYRQLSNKTIKAWKVERWMIHSVLVFAVVMTAGVIYTYWTGASWFLFFDSYKLREVYGAFIGAGFAGVVGTGFYPLMGNRVWCRFGCPLAAYLGLVQRFKSRFRITTNGGQCISCGNCSTYCEMGIDVRWYAQRGQNIVRSSCVGCGVCSSVCPRGVLNLEVKDEAGRFGKPILIGNNHIKI